MMQSHTAQVFLLNLQELNLGVYQQFYEVVSPQRRERADRYCRYEDALRCVMSEILLRYVYRQIRSNTQKPEFIYPPRGKPYLADDRAFYFSVSHTGEFIAVGYAQEEIGIDIEQINRPLDRKRIAESVFTAEEQAYIFGTWKEGTCMLRFAELWTAKESYLKYLGCGFGKNPLSFSINWEEKTITENNGAVVPKITIIGTKLPKNYYLTVCGSIEELSIKSIPYHSIRDI